MPQKKTHKTQEIHFSNPVITDWIECIKRRLGMPDGRVVRIQITVIDEEGMRAIEDLRHKSFTEEDAKEMDRVQGT